MNAINALLAFSLLLLKAAFGLVLGRLCRHADSSGHAPLAGGNAFRQWRVLFGKAGSPARLRIALGLDVLPRRPQRPRPARDFCAALGLWVSVPL